MFFFSIEINTDTINSSIKLEKDKKTSCLQQLSVGFVNQGSKLLWLIKRPDSSAFTTNIGNLASFLYLSPLSEINLNQITINSLVFRLTGSTTIAPTFATSEERSNLHGKTAL